MSATDISKAEWHYFKPAELISRGIPERCANCPGLNNVLARIALNFVDLPTETASDKVWSRQNQAERAKLMEKVSNCGGYVTLGNVEAEAIISGSIEDAQHLAEIIDNAGYVCGTTGEVAVASTFADGVVQLSYRPSLEVS